MFKVAKIAHPLFFMKDFLKMNKIFIIQKTQLNLPTYLDLQWTEHLILFRPQDMKYVAS